MNGTLRIVYLCSIFLCMGCAARQGIFADQYRQQDSSMARLERGVQGLCGDLVKNIKPGSTFVTWHDSLHPNTPVLLEEYIVSMFEGELIRRGFPISTAEKNASYKLMLSMTPSQKTTLVLASVWQGDEVVATKEAHFTNGPEKWSRALCSYRMKTKTTIHIGGTP